MQSGSHSQAISYSIPVIIFTGPLLLNSNHSRASNFASTGGDIISVWGQGFQLIDSTISARTSESAGENSLWISDSSVMCRISQGSWATGKIIVTSGMQGCSGSSLISYDDSVLAFISAESKVNQAISGQKMYTLFGSSFGLNVLSPCVHMALSQGETTTWLSDTSLKSQATCGSLRSLSISITAGQLVGSLSSAWTYDSVIFFASLNLKSNITHNVSNVAGVLHTHSFGSNHPTSSGQAVQLISYQLGLSGMSGASRSAETSCEMSFWISDTSLNCKVASGVRGTLIWTLTAGSNPATLTETLSFDRHAFFNQPNSFANTSSLFSRRLGVYNLMSMGGSVSISGSSFSNKDYSSIVRTGYTSCEVTSWISSSNIACKHGRGIRSTLLVFITTGLQYGTMTESFSIDLPSFSKNLKSNVAMTGSISLTISGVGLGEKS